MVGAVERFPSDLASAGAARRWLAGLLPWTEEAKRDEALLLASELVTNSIQHASGEVEVCASIEHDQLRVEVVDSNPRLPHPIDAEPTAVSGRGLSIVEAIADRWGTEYRPKGKVVWFELAMGPHPSLGNGGSNRFALWGGRPPGVVRRSLTGWSLLPP
jgi:anti-sigma regulatory factor (Ser/Thr protein kinase)